MSGNWWATSDGENVTDDVKKEYDAGGGGFDVIPAKTFALATISNAAWKEYDGSRYVNITWSIEKDVAYLNRKVFHKIWCGDLDKGAKDPAKKRDKALRMLATIDANAGGKLAKAGREPDDDDLAMALIGKQMIILLMTYPERDKDNKEIKGTHAGNWVQGVFSKGSKELTVPPKPSTGNGGPQTRRTADDDDLDRDVPF